jgi:hypothetical protein
MFLCGGPTPPEFFYDFVGCRAQLAGGGGLLACQLVID